MYNIIQWLWKTFVKSEISDLNKFKLNDKPHNIVIVTCVTILVGMTVLIFHLGLQIVIVFIIN